MGFVFWVSEISIVISLYSLILISGFMLLSFPVDVFHINRIMLSTGVLSSLSLLVDIFYFLISLILEARCYTHLRVFKIGCIIILYHVIGFPLSVSRTLLINFNWNYWWGIPIWLDVPPMLKSVRVSHHIIPNNYINLTYKWNQGKNCSIGEQR